MEEKVSWVKERRETVMYFEKNIVKHFQNYLGGDCLILSWKSCLQTWQGYNSAIDSINCFADFISSTEGLFG